MNYDTISVNFRDDSGRKDALWREADKYNTSISTIVRTLAALYFEDVEIKSRVLQMIEREKEKVKV